MILLDGLGHHLSIGAVQANFLPHLVFGSAEDPSVLSEHLGHENMVVIDETGSILHSLLHSSVHNHFPFIWRIGRNPYFRFSGVCVSLFFMYLL